MALPSAYASETLADCAEGSVHAKQRQLSRVEFTPS
jgi:hypothetical protein